MNTLNMNNKKKAGNSVKLKLLISISVFVLALFFIYMGVAMYFHDRFYFGSVINDMKVSGKTAEEVEARIAEEIKKYSLYLDERGDSLEEIHASDIGLTYVSDGKIAALLEKQNSFAWPVALFRSEGHTMSATTEYDEQKLKEVYQQLALFHKDNVIEPVDAYPEYKEETKKYEIVPEVYGSKPKKEELLELIKTAIKEGKTEVSLEENNCYYDPEFTVESKEVITATEKLNSYMSAELTYKFGDKQETVDSSIIHKWLTLSDNWKVSLDETKVREFVDYIGSTYNTIQKKRPFTTSKGKKINITEGDYGWWLNRDKETAELIEAVKNGDTGIKEPNYVRKAASYSDPDYGNTYVEISIKDQKMWFYKNGEKLVETDVVTGLITDEDRKTPTGIYGITFKKRNATLTGEGYASPVDYWMPFWYNVGIHDADGWRSSYGGNIYKTSGSHGCVNTPHAKAKIIYENIEEGDPVIVY